MAAIDFGDRHIAGNLIRTSIPMLVAQLLSLLYSIVDRIYLGRLPGEGAMALGAVGLCFPVIMVVMAFTNMFGMGGSPLFSIARGRADRERAGEILSTAFRLLVLSSVLILAVGEVFSPVLLRLFGADDSSLPVALSYLRVYLLGTPFFMLSTGLNPYINAQGFPRSGMLTVVIGAVSNLILDPFFIFILGMGVQGAALATVLSQGLSFAFVMRFFYGGKSEYSLGGFKLSFPHAREIMGLGLAPFIMQCTNSLVQIACNSTLAAYGGQSYVTVMTIVSSVRQILDVPASAVTEGASPMISYNYGAGNTGHVRRIMLLMFAVAMTYSFLTWRVVEHFPELFIGIFSADPEIMEKAVPALHIYFYAFFFQSWQYSGQTVFKALGKKKRTIFFSLFRKVVMVVPLTFLLPRLGYGTNGVFMAEPISNVIGGVACFATMLLTILPELRRMEREAAAS